MQLNKPLLWERRKRATWWRAWARRQLRGAVGRHVDYFGWITESYVVMVLLGGRTLAITADVDDGLEMEGYIGY